MKYKKIMLILITAIFLASIAGVCASDANDTIVTSEDNLEIDKTTDDTIGVDGLLKLMDGLDNRKAYFKESIAYCEPGKEPVVFEGITKGIIDTKKSGTYGWSWDFVFIPEGENKTLGCFPDEERWKFWSLDAYKKLVEY